MAIETRFMLAMATLGTASDADTGNIIALEGFRNVK